MHREWDINQSPQRRPKIRTKAKEKGHRCFDLKLINNIKKASFLFVLCNVYSSYSAYSTGQSAVAVSGAHNRHGIVTSGWASVAGMTRMGVETRDDDEDRVPASPFSSSGASSRRHSGSVTHSVLVLLVSVILISSLPTQVQSHKQCSHYYPRDDQVSSL